MELGDSRLLDLGGSRLPQPSPEGGDQPQVPYGYLVVVPITSLTLGAASLAGWQTPSGETGLADGRAVYKARERIHGAVADTPLPRFQLQ